MDAGVPVALFSLEMSKEQLSMRMLSSEARIDSTRLRSGFISQEDWSRITEAAQHPLRVHRFSLTTHRS